MKLSTVVLAVICAMSADTTFATRAKGFRRGTMANGFRSAPVPEDRFLKEDKKEKEDKKDKKDKEDKKDQGDDKVDELGDGLGVDVGDPNADGTESGGVGTESDEFAAGTRGINGTDTSAAYPVLTSAVSCVAAGASIALTMFN